MILRLALLFALPVLAAVPNYNALLVYTSVPGATSYRAGIDGVLWTVVLAGPGTMQTQTLSRVPAGDHVIYVEAVGTNWVSERGTGTYSLTATNTTVPGVRLIQMIPAP